MILEPGQEIEKYVVEGILGEGGMASVYRVRHKTLGSMYALKVLSIPSRTVRKRMLQEGRIQATILSSNVVQVVDVLDINGMMGLLMEYVKGPSLDEFLKENTLQLDEALAIFGGILSGVEVAHKKGLIHRDLKPANVLLHLADDGLYPKVTDFGIAKSGESADPVDVTRPGSTMGTPSYMSPEQIQDASRVDLRADIWSLGCILYELITGLRAFPGESILDILNSVVRGEMKDPTDLVDHIPQQVLDAINGSMVMNPDDRIPDCATFAAILAGKPEGSVASVGDVLKRHLPRTSDTVRRARMLAFQTPAPLERSHRPPPVATTQPIPDQPAQSTQPVSAGLYDTGDLGPIRQAPPKPEPAPEPDSQPSMPPDEGETWDQPYPPEEPDSEHSTDGLGTIESYDTGETGIERLSTEEVEAFRVEARGTIKRRTSITEFSPDPEFLGVPLPVALGAVLVLGVGLSAALHYYRIVGNLDRTRSVAAASFADEGGDTGLDIDRTAAPTAAQKKRRDANKKKAQAKKKKKKKGLVRPGMSGVDKMRLDAEAEAEIAAAAEDDFDPAEVATRPAADRGSVGTAEPRLDLPKKIWGKVKVDGDAKRVVLRAGGAEYNVFSKVAPGEYDVVAYFTDTQATHAGRIHVGREETVKLRCSVIWQNCKVQ